MITAYYTLAELRAAEQAAYANLQAANQALTALVSEQCQGMEPAEQIATAAACYAQIEAARRKWETAADAYYAARGRGE